MLSDGVVRRPSEPTVAEPTASPAHDAKGSTGAERERRAPAFVSPFSSFSPTTASRAPTKRKNLFFYSSRHAQEDVPTARLGVISSVFARAAGPAL